MTDLVRNYHWLTACVFAVWVILLSLHILMKNESVWIRILVGGFLVNVAVFALPDSFAVVLGAAAAYPLIRWLMKRDLLPSFDLASGTGLLVVSCCLSAIQLVLIVAADFGYTVYFVRNNSSYLIQILGVYVGATLLGASLGWAFRLRWLFVVCFSLVLLFLTNAYVFTLLLVPLLVGYALPGETPTFSAYLVFTISNTVVIALYYEFMSVFTLSGVGPYYPQGAAPWILGTILSPFLFGQGALARALPIR